MSGTFVLDGVTLPSPTSFGWEGRDVLGYDGVGKPAYPGVRSFRLVWEYIAPEDVNTIYGLYKAKESTGTHVASLPAYDQLYGFKEYSGCQMTEPDYSDFFEQHVSKFSFLLVRVRG